MSSSSSLQIITVAGATGKQGGSVVRALLATKRFKVRALARDTSSKAAVALAAQNVEVVYGDYSDPASLVAAFTGSFGAFLVSSVWNPFSGVPDTNYPQGKTLVDAAQAAGVQFLVWSTLNDADKMTNGEFPLSLFTEKNRVEQYIKELGIPAAFVAVGFYMSNWNDPVVMNAPVRTKDGRVVFDTPFRADSGLPVIDVEDVGQFVAPLFEDTARYNGACILASASYMTVEQMADAYSKVTGEHITVGLKDPQSLPHPVFTNAVLGCSRYGYYGGEPLQRSHDLYDNLRLSTLEDWIRRTGFTAKLIE